MKKFFTPFFLLILISVAARAQWIETGNAFFGTIRGMFFVNADTGYAVGVNSSNPLIAKTVDGGLNWTLSNSIGVSGTLRSVCFIDQSNGFICGSNGLVLKTTNGGNSWSIIDNDLSQYFRAVDFPTSQIGFLAGKAGTILKTSNGGSSWTTYNLGISDADVIQLNMLDVNTGFAECSGSDPDFLHGYIFKTTNGGTSWTQIYSNADTGFLALAAVDADTIYAGGKQDRIIKTTNGGSNWNTVYVGDSTSAYRAGFARTSNSIVMTDDLNNVTTTDDGGNNWTNELVGDNGLFAIHFPTSIIGYTGDGNGNVYKRNFNCSLPNAPGPIAGDTLVCIGSQAVYSISPVANADSFLWSVPPGATLISGQGDTTVVIQFNDSLGGIVSVASVSSSCGVGASSSLNVEITFSLPPEPIVGAESVCAGQQDVYSVSFIDGATYEWTVPDDATIISGQGDTSIVVQFGTLSGYVIVTLNGNLCGSGADSLNVSVNQLPQTAAIDGPSLVCFGDSAIYSTLLVQYADSYQWTVSGDAFILSGQGSSGVHVQFGNIPGDVTVTAVSNSCGDGPTSSISVSLSIAPSVPVEIFGDTAFCAGDTAFFWINATANSDSYTWSVPANCSIISGQGDTAIYALMGTGLGFIKVYAVNSCGQSDQIQHGIHVHPSPSPVITFSNDTLSSSLTIGNQWYYNGTAINGATGDFNVPLQNGTYYTVVTSPYGCSAASNSIEVIGLGIAAISNSPVEIYPNPSGGKTIINFSPLVDGCIIISDVNGRNVFGLKNFSGNEFNLDVSNFVNGVYLIKILNEKSELIGQKKLIVQ